MSVKEKLVPLMQAVQKDKLLSSLPSLKQMADMYSGEGQDDTSIHALQKLANGLRSKFSITDMLSIDDMTNLFKQPATEEVLLWENKNLNATSEKTQNFTLNGDGRLLNPYKLKFKFHAVSTTRGDGQVYVFTNPFLSSSERTFTVDSNSSKDYEVVFDVPEGTQTSTYTDTYDLVPPIGCTITTMAIYAVFPKDPWS